MPQEVRDGSIWTHRSARQYRVLFLANGREDVVYENYPNTDGTKWSAPLIYWRRNMTAGALIPAEGVQGAELREGEGRCARN
jgi:hypothetical protein